MMQRPIYDHASSQKPQRQATLQAANLTDLYWLVRVVEAGSFSAAAQRTGMAKSNLSRRIIQLEKRLDVQLLIRKPRALHLTPIGSRIYRHALDMLGAAEAVERAVRNANGVPSGPVHLSAPTVLSEWLYHCLRSFKTRYPTIEFCLTAADGEVDLATNGLDLALSLCSVPSDSTELVARALARLEMVIVGSSETLNRLGQPQLLDDVDDLNLLTLASVDQLLPWMLANKKRELHKAALCARDWQSLLNGARAGLGLACVPLHSCISDLRAGHLHRACPEEHPQARVLYMLTNPYRSITPTTRALVEHLRDELLIRPLAGISAVMDDNS
ncbi:LysR family transcriptional regulator [Pseudomonas sp.]|uniref:LysR family transcriptional regulator n=1 Tax=Pseudomonas sp. TaxID=306 RepID=UPI002C4A0D6B|nr:LysR substrate-binding domain-containing protein [Pseudomonas sp.]HUE92468.1 LysR substrate-binding domain-containing protein [Pseudomonas sp.]